MLRRNLFVVPVAFILFSTSGCAGSPEDDETVVGDSLSPPLRPSALNANALNANALNANALYPGALTPGMLAVDPLDPSTLGASGMAALQVPGTSGALSRQLLKYTVSCAFDNTQSFSFTWTDAWGASHVETYPGLLALATSWASQPLAGDAQAWVSACLASRLNYYGFTVSLSSRGAASGLATSSAELAAYASEEGAFWGNLFTSSPAIYACDKTADDSHSRSLYRDCAAGHLNADGTLTSCGMLQRVGSCDTHCAPLGDGHYHPSCSATGDAGAGMPVITVFLQ
jgi:hypothetical protein